MIKLIKLTYLFILILVVVAYMVFYRTSVVNFKNMPNVFNNLINVVDIDKTSRDQIGKVVSLIEVNNEIYTPITKGNETIGVFKFNFTDNILSSAEYVSNSVVLSLSDVESALGSPNKKGYSDNPYSNDQPYSTLEYDAFGMRFIYSDVSVFKIEFFKRKFNLFSELKRLVY